MLLNMGSSSEEELTARICLKTDNPPSSSSESTCTRSFYFKDEQKGLSNDESGSMEFAMFHLDISSSRPSSPEDMGCLTYNIDKNDSEFHNRMNQIKKEAFNNWLEGKINLKKKQEKEKLLAEQRVKEEKEKEEEKLQMTRERKLIEWLNRKKHEKDLKRIECTTSDDGIKKPMTFLSETKADQTKLNFDAWKLKKTEKERIWKEKEEKQLQVQEKIKEAQRSLSLEKHKLWLRTAHEKPRPVPLNQGLLSLRGSLYPIYCNAQPWISNV